MAKSVSASVSSASKSASVTAASAASVASKSLASASAKASAAAADAMGQGGRSNTMTLITAIAIVVTVLAVAIGGLYMSGYADDIMVYYAKKFYEGKAKAEMLAMQNLGEGKAKDLIKGQLKKNPILGEDELENIAPGLGKEAASEGLGGVSKKLGALGKF